MKDIKQKVVNLNLLIDKRARMLGTAMKRNYIQFNETAIDSEKIVPQHLKIDFTLNDLPADVADDILRIESIGKAFGVSVEYIKCESDE